MPYVDASGQDGDRMAVSTKLKPSSALPATPHTNLNGEGNGTTLLDPDDATTIVFVGGTGIVGGGLLSVLVENFAMLENTWTLATVLSWFDIYQSGRKRTKTLTITSVGDWFVNGK